MMRGCKQQALQSQAQLVQTAGLHSHVKPHSKPHEKRPDSQSVLWPKGPARQTGVLSA